MKLTSSMIKWLAISIGICFLYTQCKSKRQENLLSDNTAKSLVSLTTLKTSQWLPLGPFGAPEPMAETGEMSPHGAGRFMCVDIHPDNSGEILAGHASAGLFKTTDNGKTWEQKLKFPFATGIFRIIRFKKDSKHLIACSTLDIGPSRQYGYGLIESFDNGETWIRNSLQFEPEEYNLQQSRDVVILDKKKEKKLLSITDKDIYLSADGAKTWNKVCSTGLILKSIIVNPFDDNSIFVCGNGVMHSKDGGQTWENISHVISKSYGKSNSEYPRFEIAFSKKTKNKFYIASEDQNVIILEAFTDSIKQIKVVNRRACLLNISRLAFKAYFNQKTGLETLFLGTTRLYSSTDNGSHFYQISNPENNQYNSAHDDINDIVMDGKNRLYIATDGGIDMSLDHGKNWNTLTGKSLNLNTSIIFGFDKSARGYMMCGTQDNGIISLKKGIWYCSKLYGDGGRVVAINDSSGFATGFAQTNYITKNAGNTFEYKHAGNEKSGHDFRMSYHQQSNTFYLANMQLFKRKEGKYFEVLTSRINTDRKIKAFWVNPVNQDEIWLCKDEPTWGGELKNKLFYTKDGGITWLDYTYKLPILSWRSITDIYINKEGEIAITLEAFDKAGAELHKVYFSYDGGFTFVNRSAGLPNLPVNTIIYANKQWICGNNSGIYVLKNGQWETFGTEFPAVIVTELKYFESEGFLYASTFGRGMWGIQINTAN